MTECYLLDEEIVKQVEWTGDPELYDLALKRAGPKGVPFLVQNPWVADSRPFYFIDNIPETDTCIVWSYQGEWQAKYFPAKWRPEKGYTSLEIEIPQFVWRKNPDFDRAMTFEDDIFGSFKPDSWQAQHELVWYIDPRFNPLEDKVWAINCKPIGRPTLGIIDMGYVTPQVKVEYNTDLPQLDLDLDSMMPSYYDLLYENVYTLSDEYIDTKDEIWVVKITPAYRTAVGYKKQGEVSIEPVLEYNPALPKLSYDLSIKVPLSYLNYEMIYLLDRRHLIDDKDMWAFRIKFTENVMGEKVVGEISPSVTVVYNQHLPELNYDLEFYPKFYDFVYEHLWFINKKHCVDAPEPIYAFKLSYVSKILGTKEHGEIDPIAQIEYNPELPVLSYNDVDYIVPYYDFSYEHVWMLDPRHCQNAVEPIWAFKVAYTDKIKGAKVIDDVSPVITYEKNTDLPNIDIKIDYNIPYYDFEYRHIWYWVNEKNEKIWTVKAQLVEEPIGDKDAEEVEFRLPKKLDVVFISYKEPNAEENWKRVLDKAPWAKRVKDVRGIFEAHKQAAKVARTDVFYVVDGDAWLVDDWKFEFQPGIFDRDATYLWQSQNPINGLTYGYGGVKLFSKEKIKNAETWNTLDLSTTISPKVNVIDTVSCITAFNTDNFSVWRSAFREAVKLSANLDKDPTDNDSKNRLYVWCSKGANEPFGEYSVHGALDGVIYYKKHKNNLDELLKINNRVWLYNWYIEQYNII